LHDVIPPLIHSRRIESRESVAAKIQMTDQQSRFPTDRLSIHREVGPRMSVPSIRRYGSSAQECTRSLRSTRLNGLIGSVPTVLRSNRSRSHRHARNNAKKSTAARAGRDELTGRKGPREKERGEGNPPQLVKSLRSVASHTRRSSFLSA